MAVEEMFPRYGSFPGFHPIVELSMTFHNPVVGANGQRQAMFLENVQGFGPVLWRNFAATADDCLLAVSTSGCNAVTVDVAVEAKRLGMRTMVHAHSEESIRLAVLAGCTEIEHGVFATPEVMRLMAEHGTTFDPQCGLIFRNYLSNRAKYEGVGNFNEAGFASMERVIPMAANVVHQASITPNLHMVWGTDAVAGAHGHNVDDLICRVREGGQPAMTALVSAMSGGAEALGLGDQIGSIAPGYAADIIATDGDPSRDVEALHRVIFVMHGGRQVSLMPSEPPR
jgi:imidazolonepropionase-like amidohydrolase